MPHASCFMLHAPCLTPHASSSCLMPHDHASRSCLIPMPHAHASGSRQTQMQKVINGSASNRDHYEPSRGRFGRSANRQASDSSHHRRHSRSASPASGKNSETMSKSPFSASKHKPPYSKQSGNKYKRQDSSNNAHFRGGASSTSPNACAVCLGRHLHNVRTCNSSTTFDGGETKSRRSKNGRIVCISSGSVLCSDWQRPIGCSATDHPQHHLCSGCEKSDHGAQECPRAQKP
jgi:hypothetical protein